MHRYVNSISNMLVMLVMLVILIIIYLKYSNRFEGFDNIDPAIIKNLDPLPYNYLSINELNDLDTGILRNIRKQYIFSKTDELDYYQVYTLIKKYENNEIYINISDKNIQLDTLYIYTLIKLELISMFNNMVITSKYINSYHKFE